MNGVVGTLLEAWGEVRVHRARVVLSLVGVFLAVFAMTGITAAGDMGRQAVLESAERSGGRSTTLVVYGAPASGPVTRADAQRVYDGVVRRFGITYSSSVSQTGGELDPLPGAGAPGGGADGGPGGSAGSYTAYVVQPDYGVIHRITPTAGRWLTASDARRLAPAVVVNHAFLDAQGLTGQRPPLTVRLPGGTTGVAVGVVRRDEYGPELFSLPDGPQWLSATALEGTTPSLEAWVPPDRADALAAGITASLAAQGWSGDATPTGGDAEIAKVLTGVQWGIRGVSLFALALGAIGVLNVGVVTVRQRVREIGVRRALGASSARVFAAIMLESVVATALAGALGVAAAVAVVVNLPLHLVVDQLGVSEVPAFPVSAAVEAFVAATAVGALVGLVPATIAVRSKVIDAIRY